MFLIFNYFICIHVSIDLCASSMISIIHVMIIIRFNFVYVKCCVFLDSSVVVCELLMWKWSAVKLENSAVVNPLKCRSVNWLHLPIQV